MRARWSVSAVVFSVLAFVGVGRVTAQPATSGDLMYYLGQANTLQGISNRATNEGLAMLQVPRLNDPEWQAEFFGHLAVWEAVYAEAVSVVPPRSLKPVHEAALDSYRLYDLAADEIRAGVGSGDGERLGAGADLVKEGARALETAQDELAVFAAGLEPSSEAVPTSLPTVEISTLCDPRSLYGCEKER